MGEDIEDRIVEDEKRRRELNKKGSSENPETAEKTRFYATLKRERYVKEAQEDTGVPWQD